MVSGKAGRVQDQIQIKGRKKYEKDRLEIYRDNQSAQMQICLNCNCLISYNSCCKRILCCDFVSSQLDTSDVLDGWRIRGKWHLVEKCQPAKEKLNKNVDFGDVVILCPV